MRRALALLLACCAPAAPEPDPSAIEAIKSAHVECEDPEGISFHGRKRYVQGVNYAWREFATDFGGYAPWGRGGVSADSARIDADFGAIAAAGASVVRWWLFPELFGDGVVRESTGGVPAISDGALADVDRALALADRHDLYVMFTLFSFDAFRAAPPGAPDRVDLAPIVRDPRAVERLGQRFVGPLVERASRSRYAHRVFAWDLVNEPEWAVSDLGQRNMCEQKQEPTDCVSYAQMHWFLTRLSEMVAERTQRLPERKHPLVTIGAVSPWEHRNWEAVPQDFFQFHFYDFDHERGPLALPRADKPVLIGEFPSWGLGPTWQLPAEDATQIAWQVHDAGFAGGLGWTYNAQDSHARWPELASAMRTLADAGGCAAKL